MNAIKPPRPLTIVGCPSPDANTLDTCPLYLSPVSAGFPSAAEDYIDSQINLHELLVRNPRDIFSESLWRLDAGRGHP